jgi:hypothetical protein
MPTDTQSILTSTKKVLGIQEDYEYFDVDIIFHINSAFSTLNQLGLGPDAGYMIEDKTAVWGDFLGGNLHLNSVKTYIFLKLKIVFDPPQTSFVLASLQEQVRELEWRLNVERESTQWIDPDPPGRVEDEDLVIDGGTI